MKTMIKIMGFIIPLGFIALLGIAILSILSSCTTTSVVKEVKFKSKALIIKEASSFNKSQKSNFGALTEKEKWRLLNMEYNKDEVFFKVKKSGMKSVQRDIDPSTLPESVDLRKYDSPIRQQNNGRCTAFAGNAIQENLLCRLYGECGNHLSTEHAWSFYNEYSCESYVDNVKDNALANEEFWRIGDYPMPGLQENAHSVLKDSVYFGNDTNQMMYYLSKGIPVYIGMTTPRDMLSCYDVISPYTRRTSGGHALSVVGYIKDSKIPGGVTAILKNSWGSECGDNGYQYVPLGSICKRSDMYCVMWAFTKIADKKLDTVIPDPIEIVERYKIERRCKRLWYTLWIKKVCEDVKVPIK